jgi:hypothetical protein
VREIPATISPRVAPSQGLPLPVAPLRFLPAELRSIGANLAQDTKCGAVGKRLMSIDYGDPAFDLLGELGNELVECFGDDFLEVTDRSRDCGLINGHQFGDHVLCDIGTEVHDDGFGCLGRVT